MKNCPPISITFWASLATRAKDLISQQPVSISEDLTVWEAASFLIDQGLSLAPVINEAGRPVGVLSRTDIMRYQMNQAASYQEDEDESSSLGWSPGGRSDEGTLTGIARVRDIMTPALIAVGLDTPIEHVVHRLIGFEIQHLFVVDESDVLVGMISTHDVLRSLCRCPR